jgi:hypothetical protein
MANEHCGRELTGTKLWNWLRLTCGNAILLVFLLFAGGCVSITERSADDAQETIPAATPTPSPEPTLPSPTAVPSGSLLKIDGVTARQVVLWDSELPAEYAASQTSLFRRTDNRNWTRVGSLPIEGRLLADPSDPEWLYLGDHPPCLTESDPIPFYRSDDGGKTWHQVEDVYNIRPILVWQGDRDVIIGSRCGLAISQDRGVTWDRYLPDSEFDLTRLIVTPIGLYGVFQSEREISYLRRIVIEDPSHPTFEEPIISFWGPGAIHATGDRILVGEPGGVHFSDDGGRTWSTTREGLDDVVTSVDPLEEDIPDTELEAGFGIYALLPHPGNSDRIFLGTIRGLYLSEDGGQSWGRIPEVNERQVRHLTFAMGGSILYVATDDGIIVLNNP